MSVQTHTDSEPKVKGARIIVLLRWLWLLVLLWHCAKYVLVRLWLLSKLWLLCELRLLWLSRHQSIEWILTARHLRLVRVHSHSHASHAHIVHTTHVIHRHTLAHHRLEASCHWLESASTRWCSCVLILLWGCATHDRVEGVLSGDLLLSLELVCIRSLLLPAWLLLVEVIEH